MNGVTWAVYLLASVGAVLFGYIGLPRIRGRHGFGWALVSAGAYAGAAAGLIYAVAEVTT